MENNLIEDIQDNTVEILLNMLISLEPHLRLNSQEEINKWKEAKKLIVETKETLKNK